MHCCFLKFCIVWNCLHAKENTKSQMWINNPKHGIGKWYFKTSKKKKSHATSRINTNYRKRNEKHWRTKTFLKRKSKIGEKKYHKYIMFKLCSNSCTCYILSTSNGVDTYIWKRKMKFIIHHRCKCTLLTISLISKPTINNIKRNK